MSQQRSNIRICVAVFAAILGIEALWILTPELIRPAVPFFPTQTTAPNPKAAVIAAQIGWLRGDLWADAAVASDAEILDVLPRKTGSQMPARFVEMRAITDTAAKDAPFDSRVWLLAAALNSRSGQIDRKAANQLKMSFYTSPNDDRLIPLRIRLALQFNFLSDDELQYLIEQQIRTAALHKPELKPAIAAAYQDASPAGQQFIEGKLAEIDPHFLAELRSTAH